MRFKVQVKLGITLAVLIYLNINFAQEMRLEIKDRTELTGIPSASGIEFYRDSFYIIGDNSAWLYHFNTSFQLSTKYQIHAQLNRLTDTIPKKEKPDFEATTIVTGLDQDQLFIFGSGSKSPIRDILVKVDLSNPASFQSVALEKFYAQLKSGGISELNIEGAVYANGFLYLLNRADNSIIRFAYSEFELFLKSSDTDLTFTHHKFVLPIVDNVQAAFSGASIIPGTSKMIFTASVEQTDNWIDDGAILGSYVGVIDLERLNEASKPQLVPLLEGDNVLKIKVESITVRSVNKHKIKLFMVTDSDGGSSELIEANLFED
jgi:hypothetical protein